MKHISLLVCIPILVAAAICGLGIAQTPLQTFARDFALPGTLPQSGGLPVESSQLCAGCHGGYDEAVEPYGLWASSMMAQATRDPVFHAALAIAEQDSEESGYMCLSCHAPGGWMDGRGVPTDGSVLDNSQNDFDGVTCHFCHRLVDPILAPNHPPSDAGILAALLLPPGADAHSGQYVVDPNDSRRGPFDLGAGFSLHSWDQSAFHRDSRLCGSCHDISNPIFERLANGKYVLGPLGTDHPTMARADMFPVERTFSEWEMSVFAITGQDTGGRFGGDDPVVQSCQDCHMPTARASASVPGLGTVRSDMPQHFFAGANSWVLRAVDALWPRSETGLTPQRIEAGLKRNVAMLKASADLEADRLGNDLRVRIINRCGHKLPTGYGEGRRMWIEVRFEDANGVELAVHGGYQVSSATLDSGSTKVYELIHGLDNYMANITGLAAGPSFHFVLNNEVLLDNRIPPRGYSRNAFASRGAEPVAYDYVEQQYWDDTFFPIPSGATKAEIRLRHQTSSREFMEFLRDENTTNSAGTVAFDLWKRFGKSAPVEMGHVTLDLGGPSGLTPIEFGLGKETVQGSYPQLTTTGSASAALGSLHMHVTGGQPGGLSTIYQGSQTQSRRSLGGTLLIQATGRLTTQLLDANGELSVSVPITPDMVGTSRAYQALYRDTTTPSGFGMTSAVWIDFAE